MKKRLLALVACLALAFCSAVAFADNYGGGYGGHDDKDTTSVVDLKSSTEGQAFSNMESSYGQGVSTEKQTGNVTTFKDTDTCSSEVSGYGSIHENCDTLFFGKLTTTFTDTNTNSITCTKFDANIQSMTGANKMNQDAGASAVACNQNLVKNNNTILDGTSANAGSTAGNTQSLSQNQTQNYLSTGFFPQVTGSGSQAYNGSSYTSVVANAN